MIFILDVQNFMTWQKASSALLLWTLNVLVIFFCMAKILVYGDPLLGSETRASEAYWKHKNIAEQEFSKVHYIILCIIMHAFNTFFYYLIGKYKKCIHGVFNMPPNIWNNSANNSF